MSYKRYIQKLIVEVNWMHKNYGLSKFSTFFHYIYSFLRVRCSIRDYECYHFFEKRVCEMEEYLLFNDMIKWYSAHNKKETEKILDNKEMTLNLLSEFVNRDWCGTNINNDILLFEKFYKNHKSFIVKPLDAMGGVGIRFEKSSSYASPEQLKDAITKNNEIIEELIMQHDSMSLLSPSSINTIRIFTLVGEIYGAVVRMGNGIKRIDNASSGGLFAGINVTTGYINSSLYNFKGQSWESHPMTGLNLQGFQIPFWKDCIVFVSKASKYLSDIPLIGWDIAITPNGPTLVEANACPDIPLLQVSLNMGIKSKFTNDTSHIPVVN